MFLRERDMMDLLSNLIGLVTAVGLILTALVYMFRPKTGCEMFKRLAVVIVGALVGLSIIRCFLPSVGLLPLVLSLAAISFVSYLIREARRPRNLRQAGHVWGAERTPLMPTHIEEEDP